MNARAECRGATTSRQCHGEVIAAGAARVRPRIGPGPIVSRIVTDM